MSRTILLDSVTGSNSPTLGACIVAALVALMPATAVASQLLVPCIGTPDCAMNGATVAEPQTPTAAAYSNPAGLTLFEPGAVSGSLGIAWGHTDFDASAPPGYSNTDGFTGYAPEGTLVLGGPRDIRAALSLYGSLGAAFDTDAQPDVGVPVDFLSKFAIVNVSAAVAWKASDRVSFGVGLALLLGDVKLRYTTDIPYSYNVWGPGVQAIAGVRWQVTDAVALGLGLRSPGMVWADGDHRLPSGEKQDVELDLDQPAQLFLGLNADVTEKLHVGLTGRWTDASQFSKSEFEFEKTPSANVRFIADANDEWRIGLGAGYELTDRLTVRISASYADEIVGDRSVSPLLIDTEDWKIGGGFSFAFTPDVIADVMAGHSFEGDADVSPSEASIFPGEYRMSGQVLIVGLRVNL